MPHVAGKMRCAHDADGASGIVKIVPCRDSEHCGALRPLLPGQRREQVFCPTCAYKHKEPGCIFNYCWNPDERLEQETRSRQERDNSLTQNPCQWPGCHSFAGAQGHYCPIHAGLVGHGITPGSSEAKWVRV